ncbi:MAG: type I-MYXAN CRISPR-associated protein Cas6/Cmx6 [Gammaproteobacteria bacterium]|nr:type I-MYXAN CRISPR-associated protein Cas6/Cmx6 [Gammaproteobacteria bacterium]
MYWEQDKKSDTFTVIPDRVVDLVYSISCRALPVDHAYALSQAIQAELSWFAEEPLAAIQTIHVAESGNGWFRPDSPEQLLYPSKRTKLILRIPKHRIEDAASLLRKTLQVDGNPVTITRMSQRPLSAITTLFCRYVIISAEQSESQFLESALNAFKAMNVYPRKMLCGKETLMRTPHGLLKPRSLMLADLKYEESIVLQQNGLGVHRMMGCGIFLPHKGINEIGETMV